MLLRRITKHVKEQNWIAVGIDFVIVVIGVFVGIQVANWNSANQLAEQEAAVIEQLHGEFSDAIAALKTAKTSSEQNVQSTRDVLGLINSGEEPADASAFMTTLDLAASFSQGPPQPVTLSELISSGGLSELSKPELRTVLTKYHEKMAEHDSVAALILQRISTPDDGFHDAVILNPNAGKPNEPPFIGYDWELIADTRQQFQVILYSQLWLDATLSNLVVLGEDVIEQLESER